MGIRVEPLRAEHIDPAVEVHMSAFQEFFLTFLGPSFLREFYRSFLVDPAGIGFVAVDSDSGEVLGAVVGPATPGGYFGRLLKRRWWAFCLASVRAVLRRPSVVKRLARAIYYRGDAPDEQGPARALLSSIAVSPAAQGRGVGRALVETWMAEARRRGSRGAFLTTDAEENEAVNRFYQRLGWRLESTYATREGRRMNRYVVDFPQAQEGYSD